MRAKLLRRTARVACVAILLALGAAPGAEARDLYWQGRRGDKWEHGHDPNTGLSNWYSKAVGGNALRAPNGGDRAIFPPAQETTDIWIRRDEDVSSLHIEPTATDYGYTFWVRALFSIVGDGILNDGPAGVTPQFVIARGKQLAMRNHAIIGEPDFSTSAARFRILDSGVLSFWEFSAGGNAEVVNNGGRVTFAGNASAAHMRITNRPQQPDGSPSSIRFHDNSWGISADLTNGENGLIDFATQDRSNTVERIHNNGNLHVGANRLHIKEGFTQGPLGTLWIDRAGAFHGAVIVEGVAKLGGKLKVGGFFGAAPGTYVLLRATGGRQGKFAEVDAFGGRIAYGANRVVIIVDPPP